MQHDEQLGSKLDIQNTQFQTGTLSFSLTECESSSKENLSHSTKIYF